MLLSILGGAGMFRCTHLTSFIISSVVSVGAVCALALVVSAQERDRSKVSDQYKWDLTHIYPSDEAWRTAKDKLVAEFPKLKAFKGTLGSSASRLADALELSSRLSKEFARSYVYASMMSDTDTRVSKYQGMQQEMIQLGSTLARGRRVHRAGDPEDRQGDDRQVRRLRAAAEGLPAVPRRHPAAGGAHPDRRRGAAPRQRRRDRERAVGHLRHLLGRRLPVPERRR